eukprot:GFUD01010465.1.p1 GENE.GFUD01010465.1~~GFUD01010465.1.p1  ORF type:complete len:992 (-),score=270.61 GFUD01010465.1:543-3518(-)
MSRLSSIGRTPISDRIKLFDNGATTVKKSPRTAVREKPSSEPSTLETPKLRPVPRSQFSVKDPSSVKPSLNTKVSKSESNASTKSDLKVSRGDSNSSTKSDLKVSKTDSSSSSKSDAKVSRADSNASTKSDIKSSPRVSPTNSASSSKTDISGKPAKATSQFTQSLSKKTVNSPKVSKKPIASNQSQEPPKTKISPNKTSTPNREHKTSISRTPSNSNSNLSNKGGANRTNSSNSTTKPSTVNGNDKPDLIPESKPKKTEEIVHDPVFITPVDPIVPDVTVNESPNITPVIQAEKISAERKISEKNVTERKISEKSVKLIGSADDIKVKDSPLVKTERKVSEKKVKNVDNAVKAPVIRANSIVKDVEEIQKDEILDKTPLMNSNIMNNERKVSDTIVKNIEIIDQTPVVNSNKSFNERKLSQKYVKSFDPTPTVNKNKLIEEFNEIQEKNVKNTLKNIDDSIVNNNMSGHHTPANKQYFTNQALNNANSTTINQAMKLDVEFKDDKIGSLSRVLDDLDNSGANEGEVKHLKKQKQDLDIRLRDQEEELDDLAGQVQLLEASKTKMEMQIQQLKKDHRREIQSKEDDLEDARAAAGKKVKIIEQQLEQEHEERISFVRERHELEGKIMNLQDMLERSGDEEQVAKLKKDLKRTKALLRDAQLIVEKTQNEGTNKVIMRQLKNQLEDAEFARAAAMKAKQNSELELEDVQQQLEDVSRAKSDTEDKNLRLSREKADLQTNQQENEEELQDVMRKYKASVAAVSTDQITIQDQAATIQELENERNKLREQYAEISQRLDHMEGENVSTAQHKRIELKIRELESKLELEKTTKGRMETQIYRQKEVVEKMTREMDDLRIKEQNSQDDQKKMCRQLRDNREELSTLQGKEVEMSHKKSDLEKQLEVSEAETLTVRNELKTAQKRIEDLQVAISGEIDSDTISDQDSDSSDEDMASFLDHHRRAMSVQRERESMARESVMRDIRRREKPFDGISEED